MEKTEFFQALTLWFVVLIFLQTVSGNLGGAVDPLIEIIAVALTYLVPLYLLIGLGAKLVDS